MKIFCITGCPSADLDQIASILAQAGMAAPHPSHQHDGLTLTRWHEQVLATAHDDPNDLTAIPAPGRLWEQLATNLFVENMVSPVWGWADARSLWLLDFWCEFEPHIHFILVYTSPLRTLSSALAQPMAEQTDLPHLLNHWQAQQRELLRFYQQHAQRCLFVTADECLAEPQALLEACAQRWKLQPNPEQVLTQAPPRCDSALAQFLAQQWLAQWPALDSIRDLQAELEACVASLRPSHVNTAATAPVIDATMSAEITAAIADYQHWQQQQTQAARTAALAHARQLQVLTDELAESKRQLEQEKSLQHVRQFASHAKRHHPAPHARQHSHLPQTAVDASAKAMAPQSALIAEYRAQLDAMKQTIAQLQSQLAASRQEEATLLTQPTNLDFAAGMRAASAHIQQLQQPPQAASEAQLAQLASDAAQQLAEMQVQLMEARNTASDALADSELLKAQLNEAQIELDHYFQSWKEAQREIAELNARWQRMLDRDPLYYEYQSLCIADSQLAPSEQDGAQNMSYAYLFIDELSTADRYYPLLQVRCEFAQEGASFVFDSATAGACNALLHWPTDRNGKALSQVIVSAEQQASLERFATNDWHLQLVLCKILRDAILNQHLTEESAGALFAVPHLPMLLASLENLQQALQAMPAVMRFDSVRLMSEQVDKDDEHIWLELGNVSFGTHTFDNFEFRLSCSHLGQKEFGEFPKLEFPALTGQAPFENWFGESRDDFGDKLELRFTMPETMDFGVWQRLSEHDQRFITALIAQLPALLQRLQHAKVALSRSWDSWQIVAHNLSLILQRKTGGGLDVALEQQLPAFMLETAFELRTATAFKFAANEVTPPAANSVAPIAPVASAENDTSTLGDDSGAELETDLRMLLAFELGAAKN